VEIQLDDGASVPLIDGPVVGNRYELTAATDVSRLILVVHDDSVLLNRDEKVVLFEDLAPADIASTLISEYGLTPDVGTAPDAGAALERVVVQRGTNMQLLRELGRRFGMFVYVKPGDTPGQSVGVFQRPQLSPGALPDILLLGPDRNINSFSAEFEALRPITAKASSVKAVDKSVLTGQTSTADLPALGDTDAHAITQPATTLLSRTREEQTDLDAAAAAAVDLSSWAYTARGELDADTYAGVLTPHEVVRVAGAGGYLSGDYLVGRVTHVISDAGYKQRFALHRNARSSGTGGGVSIPGGIF
jgi:phage protein D